MKFFEKLGKVLLKDMPYTITFVAAFILFLYFAGGDMIGGILTAVSALIAYISAALIYSDFKNGSSKTSKKKK